MDHVHSVSLERCVNSILEYRNNPIYESLIKYTTFKRRAHIRSQFTMLVRQSVRILVPVCVTITVTLITVPLSISRAASPYIHGLMSGRGHENEKGSCYITGTEISSLSI